MTHRKRKLYLRARARVAAREPAVAHLLEAAHGSGRVARTHRGDERALGAGRVAVERDSLGSRAWNPHARRKGPSSVGAAARAIARVVSAWSVVVLPETRLTRITRIVAHHAPKRRTVRACSRPVDDDEGRRARAPRRALPPPPPRPPPAARAAPPLAVAPGATARSYLRRCPRAGRGPDSAPRRRARRGRRRAGPRADVTRRADVARRHAD